MSLEPEHRYKTAWASEDDLEEELNSQAHSDYRIVTILWRPAHMARNEDTNEPILLKTGFVIVWERKANA
jgi:hypothetical protein